MATLKVKVTTRKMPHTSEFFAVVKAVEHFYYALLFSTDAAYAGRDDPWGSWVRQGFSAAIRQAPPDAAASDYLTTSVRSDGKLIELTATSAHADVLDRVAAVLSAVDAYRAGGLGGDEGAGAPSPEIQNLLLEPVANGLGNSKVDERVSGEILEVLHKGLRALTYRDVTAIEVSADVAAV